MIDTAKLGNEFAALLEETHYNEGSRESLRYMIRRVFKALDGYDLANQTTVLHYRLKLGESGTLHLFDTLWKLLLITEEGEKLQPVIRRPAVLYPHPLYADVMVLGAAFTNERLVEMTWGDAKNRHECDDQVLKAMARVFMWFSEEGKVPTPDTPVIVKDPFGKSMKLWQVEYILNSSEAYRQRKGWFSASKIAELLSCVIALSTVRGVDPKTLRLLCGRVHSIGSNAKAFKFREARQDIEGSKTLEEIIQIVDQFPVDEKTTATVFW